MNHIYRLNGLFDDYSLLRCTWNSCPLTELAHWLARCSITSSRCCPKCFPTPWGQQLRPEFWPFWLGVHTGFVFPATYISTLPSFALLFSVQYTVTPQPLLGGIVVTMCRGVHTHSVRDFCWDIAAGRPTLFGKTAQNPQDFAALHSEGTK